MTSQTVLDAGTGLSPQQVLAALPHRFPFLLVDRVDSVSADKIVAIKNVSFGEPFFQGHFPGVPIMPGVLIVEALAQAATILAAQTADYDPQKQVVYFVSMNNVKFRKPVIPGDQIRLEVVPLRKGKIWKLRGEAFVSTDLVCEADFVATVADK